MPGMSMQFMTIRQLRCRECGTIGIWAERAEKDGKMVSHDLPGDALVGKVQGSIVCGRCGHKIGDAGKETRKEFALYVGGKLMSRTATLRAAKEAAISPILRGEAVRITRPASEGGPRAELYDYEADEWVQTR
jgi:dissimilatory sulfite reductase (desulfoviridin) alpha/beta subunit